MALLTPNESHAFQNFLSTLDFAEFSSEWDTQLEMVANTEIPSARGREALQKATKDLMSLDLEKWKYAAPPPPPPSRGLPLPSAQQKVVYPYAIQRFQGKHPHMMDTSESSEQPCWPVIQSQLNSMSRARRGVDSSSGAAEQSICSPKNGSSPSSSRLSPIDLSVSPPSSNAIVSTKRSPPRQSDSSNKRSRTSLAASSETIIQSQMTGQYKPALLSHSQKKANHIQSEQKRRANIRRGYEALCETVPALREAIRLEEEANRLAAKSGSKGKRKGKAKILTSDDGEKLDGRAGPRSENIVLAKAIDYINELLSERENLTRRLRTAQTSLGENHILPAGQTDDSVPLWERKWTGGAPKDEDDDEDYDDD